MNKTSLALTFWLSTVLGQVDSPRVSEAPRVDHEQDRGRLSLVDLARYHQALDQPLSKVGEAPTATFEDFWSQPALAGRYFTVRGRITRRFRQPPLGTFPALSETWVVDAQANPLCLVSPQNPGGEPAIGTWVSFIGQFQRVIRYQASDEPRLAPLVVGPEPPRPGPSSSSSGPEPDGEFSPWRPADYWLGGVLAVLAAAVLLIQHLRGLARRRVPIDDPRLHRPVEFIDRPPPGESSAAAAAEDVYVDVNQVKLS